MKFPLIEDMINNSDSKTKLNKVVSAFVLTVNSFYEAARKGESKISYVTGDILKAEFEQMYNKKPSEEMAMLLDVTAECINDALQQGAKDAATNETKEGAI